MFQSFHDEFSCIFIHIPKTAGTSVERAIFKTDHWLVGHRKALDYVKFDEEKFHSYFSFAFVRNPFDRIVSAFHYLKQGGGNTIDKNFADEHLKDCLDFRSFILALKNDTFKEKILSWMHFVPQYIYVCDEDKNILVDFLGKFESLEEDFSRLLELLNRKEDLSKANKSKHLSFKKYYDDMAFAVVKELYKDDFELFDYNKKDLYSFEKNLKNKDKKILDNNLLNLRQIKNLYNKNLSLSSELKYLNKQKESLSSKFNLLEQKIKTLEQDLSYYKSEEFKLKMQILEKKLRKKELENEFLEKKLNLNF